MDSNDSEQFQKTLVNSLKGFGISPDDPRFDSLLSHYNLLVKFNRIINLTSLKDPSKIAYRLFADSLLPLSFLKSFKSPRIIDIGSGGGFPSVPLCLFAEVNASFTLVDSRKKAIFFLEELISSIPLSNIKPVHGHIADFKMDLMFHGKFDLAFNKAALKGDFFLAEIRPFLKTGGLALHWTKSQGTEQEAPEGWEIAEIIGPPVNDSRFPGVVVVYEYKS